ncbi:MAG: KpsF/GutQ family sugar-phosphate isomerase [Desulfovibrionaceae bacterium]
MPTPDPKMNLLDVAREVLDVEIQGLQEVRGQLGDGFSAALERLARCTGRVVVSGIGKSGLVGRKIAATLSSTGTPAFFLHPVEGAHGDMGMIRPEDVVLAISNSGETDELNAILPTLRSLGAFIISLTSKTDSSMALLSDVVIPIAVPREACPMGLAPTASTTAALAVGDALAVCLMQRNGFDKGDFRRFHPGGALGQRLSKCVGELMHVEELPVVSIDASLAQALDVLNAGGFGLAVLAAKDGPLLGVLSDGDVRRLACRGPLPLEAPAAEVMTRSPKVARADQSAAQVLDIMESHQITVLPVVNDKGELAGLIHLHDLLGKGRFKFSSQ